MPTIVTICGSMKFFDQMLQVAADETAKGNIVLAPFCIVAPESQGDDHKAMLDRLHRDKIDMSDSVIIVTDQDGYIGTSTRAEMVYAAQRGIAWDVREFNVEPPAAAPDTHRARRGDDVEPVVCYDHSLLGQDGEPVMAPVPGCPSCSSWMSERAELDRRRGVGSSAAPDTEPATPIEEVVDDLVGIWHDDPDHNTSQTLAEFLGLSADEETAWGRDAVIPARLHAPLRELHRSETGDGFSASPHTQPHRARRGDDVMRDDDIAIPSIAETGREFVCLDPVELERLRAIEKRADETQTWCGRHEMHRAITYIRTGELT